MGTQMEMICIGTDPDPTVNIKLFFKRVA